MKLWEKVDLIRICAESKEFFTKKLGLHKNKNSQYEKYNVSIK
jgi:hypothetical protein